MSSQPSPITEPPSGSVRPHIGRYFLRALLALSLIYYAALVFDLVLHPLAPNVGSELIVDRFLEALTGTGVIVVGAFIMARVPGNRVGPLLILYGVGDAGSSMRVDLGPPLLTSIAHFLYSVYLVGVALPALVVLLASFPTGQIYPRWAARWVTLYILLAVIGGTLSIMSQSPVGAAPYFSGLGLPVNPLFIPALAPYNALINQTVTGFSLLFLLAIVGVVVSLFLRYRAAQMRERQQIKWLIWVTGVVAAFGALLFVGLAVGIDVISALERSALGTAFVLLFYSLVNISPVIGIGLAILRHGLWEIDIIINRTLVYGTLTVLLALLYFGLVIGLESLVRLFTGQVSQSPVIIVASTLTIAALFQPLRHRIQWVIDRRFYRRKYDAARTVAAFSATLRNEVELTQLSEHLVAVVQETMQPAHVSLWLRPASHERTEHKQP